MVNTVVFVSENYFNVINIVCAKNYTCVFYINLTINMINYLVFKIDLRMYCEVKTRVKLLLLLLLLLSSSSSHLCSVFTIIYLKQNMFLG
jgi:hypothetical protein